MEELRAELAAKSCQINIGSQKHSLFYSWTIYDEAKKNGITIDAHALADPERVICEVTKIIYVCILCHRSVARKINVWIPKEAPTLKDVEALLIISAKDATKAMNYVRQQMSAQIEEQKEQKKRLNENSTDTNVN